MYQAFTSKPPETPPCYVDFNSQISAEVRYGSMLGVEGPLAILRHKCALSQSTTNMMFQLPWSHDTPH